MYPCKAENVRIIWLSGTLRRLTSISIAVFPSLFAGGRRHIKKPISCFFGNLPEENLHKCSELSFGWRGRILQV